MAEKSIKTRVQMKRGSSEEWGLAAGFKPLEGEQIFYTDLNKTKVGKYKPGTTEAQKKSANHTDYLMLLSELPFLDADTLDGKRASDFALKADIPTKSSLGLTNVTNDAQVKRTEMGVASGVATLDSTGRVPTSQLPSYVDDVVEGTLSAFPTTGETGKIYVDTVTNKTYRWSGSAYVEISASLALGETSSTAYRGDRGKTAYDHSQTAHAPSNAEKNQNAFSNIAVSGQTTVAADTATDTLTLAAGNNITITTDAANDKITIAAVDTVYTHPNSGVTAGTYRTVTVNAQGHVTGGSNPTTLSGHGITDAYTKAEVEAKINTLISHGTDDPSSETTSQYYFKYN